MGTYHTHAEGPMKSIILPLPKEYGDMGRVDSGARLELFRAIAVGPVFYHPWGGTMQAVCTVRCKEHQRNELLPWTNYHYDLNRWYKVGRHPRFSVIGALLRAKQNYYEIQDFTSDHRGQQESILAALKTANTEKQFTTAMEPHLFTHLSLPNRRRIRVTNSFKRKYVAKDFTVKDFLDEQNQEIRRAMLRVLPIKAILKHMEFVTEDDEGKLYDFRPNAWTNRRYLYVKCPSTAQEYLLEVPGDINEPKRARRWTFNLPAEAQFSKEA